MPRSYPIPGAPITMQAWPSSWPGIFSSQTTQYKVVKARVLRPSVREGNDYFVDSEVFLKNGQKYNVRWRLKRRKSGFKIVDVQVLGFWLTPFQRNLFRDYIQKHNGNVNALLIALSY